MRTYHQPLSSDSVFFFNDTATTEIYTLSLHDALPISWRRPALPRLGRSWRRCPKPRAPKRPARLPADRKSTRLNSSHGYISYAVFCLQKKKDHVYASTTLLHYYDKTTSDVFTSLTTYT